MERLVTTAQAAELLGISLQGVHYRIRNKKLKSIKQAGKTYVYVPEDITPPLAQETSSAPKNTSQTQRIVDLKDEQIILLKKSIKWLRRQHKDEIDRLEMNQEKIIEVFKSEIQLLQSAFNEMRSIYKPQVEHKRNSVLPQNQEQFISVQDFALYLKKHHKSTKEIKLTILNALNRKDARFVYNKKTKKILILNEDFSDLL